MTVSDNLKAITSIPAFQACSETTLKRIQAEATPIRFGIGQVLSNSSIIPNRVLLLLSGKARLLGHHKGQLNTLAMLGPGSLVGLPSLLRAEGCEEVSAATVVEAWALPDTLVAEIYVNEASFRSWCNNTVFPAELAKLLSNLLSQCQRMPFGLLDVLGKVMPTAQAEEGREDLSTLLDETKQVFIASANSSAELNTELRKGEGLPSSKGPFSLRLLSLPQSIVEQIRSGRETANISISPDRMTRDLDDDNDDLRVQLPARSSLDLRWEDPRKTLKLITRYRSAGRELGLLSNAFHELMGLPFRRDALEKTIRDALRRGKHPTLQCSANLQQAWAPRIRDKGSLKHVYTDECAMLDQLG